MGPKEVTNRKMGLQIYTHLVKSSFLFVLSRHYLFNVRLCVCREPYSPEMKKEPRT